jgi:molybdopterin synthase catalytic subunit
VQFREYEAYAPLALRTFARIADEVRGRWPGVRLALHHRTGRVNIGEASVAIVTASPHRGDAYSSCRYVIERVKQIAPVWKREYFDGGDVWIEGATADPDDLHAREHAERIACA